MNPPEVSTNVLTVDFLQGVISAQRQTIDNFQKDRDIDQTTIVKLRSERDVAIGRLKSQSDYDTIKFQASTGYQAGVDEGMAKVFLLRIFLITNFPQILGLWQQTLDVEVAAALKCGLGLTYQQYENLRYCLSHEFCEEKQQHIRKRLAGTGLKCILSNKMTYSTRSFLPRPSNN